MSFIRRKRKKIIHRKLSESGGDRMDGGEQKGEGPGERGGERMGEMMGLEGRRGMHAR